MHMSHDSPSAQPSTLGLVKGAPASAMTNGYATSYVEDDDFRIILERDEVSMERNSLLMIAAMAGGHELDELRGQPPAR